MAPYVMSVIARLELPCAYCGQGISASFLLAYAVDGAFVAIVGIIFIFASLQEMHGLEDEAYHRLRKFADPVAAVIRGCRTASPSKPQN